MGLAKTIIDCKIERKRLKKIFASYQLNLVEIAKILNYKRTKSNIFRIKYHKLRKVKHSTSFLITIAFISQDGFWGKKAGKASKKRYVT